MATINYKGLSLLRDSITINLATATLDDLITAIAADEGLPTDYYNISIEGNPSINSIALGDSSTTCAAAGIVDGDLVICTTEQSGSRERRQIQKLEIAKVNRARTGRNDTYNRNDLPTKYSTNTVVDNPNVGGLQQGRPWS